MLIVLSLSIDEKTVGRKKHRKAPLSDVNKMPNRIALGNASFNLIVVFFMLNLDRGFKVSYYSYLKSQLLHSSLQFFIFFSETKA